MAPVTRPLPVVTLADLCGNCTELLVLAPHPDDETLACGGVMQAALAAGVPSAVIAHGFDQPFHGRRLHDLGVGPSPLKRSRLTVSTLTALLEDIAGGSHRDGYVQRAAVVGEAVRANVAWRRPPTGWRAADSCPDKAEVRGGRWPPMRRPPLPSDQ